MKDLTWHDNAACRGKDPAIFYPHQGEEIHPEAPALCAGCPVRAECLEHALSFPERVGYWAGTSAKQRREMRAARRGRLCAICGGDVTEPRARVCEAAECVREANRRRNVAWRARGVA